MTNQIVPATVEHVEFLASRLRRADLEEIDALSFADGVETSLLLSFSLSDECYVWLVGGEPAAIFGVAPMVDVPGTGCPWFLGTDKVREERRFFLTNSREWIAHFNRRYPLLENFVSPNNLLSIRWLRWCGFKFDPPAPVGPTGAVGIPFYKELADV